MSKSSIYKIFLIVSFIFFNSLSAYYSYEEFLTSDKFYDRYKFQEEPKEEEQQPKYIERAKEERERDYRESRIKLLEKSNSRRSYPIKLNREGTERDYEDIPPPIELKSLKKREDRPVIDPYFQDRRAGKVQDRFGYSSRGGLNSRLYGFDVGIKLIAENYLLVATEFPTSYSIEREIEFYSDLSYMPYFRFRFDDIKLNRHKETSLYMGNMFEFNYMNFTQQTPKFNSNGSFYEDGFVNIGTAIDIYSLFWRADFIYKFSSFYFGGFVGLGTSYISGTMLPFYFITPDEVSQDDYYRYYGFGDMVVTALDPIVVDEFGVLGKYGASLNLDFRQFHFGVGLSYGISKQSEMFWITKVFYIEVGFKF